MVRHRTLGFFAVLGLTLVMLLGAAAPALAVSDDDDVVVTASYAPYLQVDWTGFPDIAFGEVASFTYNGTSHIFSSGNQLWSVAVTSNLPYTSTLSAADGANSTGALKLVTGSLFTLTYHRDDPGNNQIIVPGANGVAGIAGGVGAAIADSGYLKLAVDADLVGTGNLHVILTITVSQS
jgi:hypothetical protein